MYSDLTWEHDEDHHWKAMVDDELVCEVVQQRGFAVHSTDGSLSGDHVTLEAAQAQVLAWSRWLDD